LDDRLASYATGVGKGGHWSFRVEDKQIKIVNLPIPVFAYKAKVYVASEITRQVPNNWDSFVVNFRPYELPESADSDYTIIVEVENLKSVRRSAGSNEPPDYSYFRRELSDDASVEVVSSILSWMGKKDGGGCSIQFFGYEESKHRAHC
jgi:hypothetical protein